MFHWRVLTMKRLMILALCLFATAAGSYAADEQTQRQEQKGKRFDATQLLGRFDQNKDGVLDAAEIPQQLKERVARLDADGDGKLNQKELQAAGGRIQGARKPVGRRPGGPNPTGGRPAGPPMHALGAGGDPLFELLDRDNDGRLSKAEVENAARLFDRDKNKDGLLELDELQQSPGTRRQGEVITPAAKGERHQETLAVGDLAPDFTLPDLSGKKEVTLSSLREKRPVVLIFASYT